MSMPGGARSRNRPGPITKPYMSSRSASYAAATPPQKLSIETFLDQIKAGSLWSRTTSTLFSSPMMNCHAFMALCNIAWDKNFTQIRFNSGQINRLKVGKPAEVEMLGLHSETHNFFFNFFSLFACL